ncbi:hypothetical protein BC629DRAFT_690514 [Irpex lacteus]|nr:hypothetical protein BC629DRAFT_690514 [Irpex lacteus]
MYMRSALLDLTASAYLLILNGPVNALGPLYGHSCHCTSTISGPPMATIGRGRTSMVGKRRIRSLSSSIGKNDDE